MSPQLEKVKQAEEEYRYLQGRRSVQDKLLQDESLLEIDRTQDHFEILLQQVPNAPNLPEAITSLEEMAHKSGVEMMGIDYRKSDDNSMVLNSSTTDKYQYEEIEVEIRGKYQKIKNFIRQIENESSRIYVLSNISFQALVSSRDRVDGEAGNGGSFLLDVPCDITAKIHIRLVYDHIGIPGQNLR